jgi:uncharacterized protein
MKNIVGQTPRGDDFYPRDTVLNRIYRRLESGNHLYLSAPRRSGKTSIMRALEDRPREGFVFIYLNVEDCNLQEDYFRLLAEALEKSDALGKLAKIGESTKNVLRNFLDRIKRVKIAGFEMETGAFGAKPTYFEAFEALLHELPTDHHTIVIMVDEFPVAVENIAKHQGPDAAVRFLHANRALRQRAETGIRFVYTGSIGLPNVARKLDPSPTINDLNIIEIPQLIQAEGLDMSRRIFATYGIALEEQVVLYMLEEIKWLMPFFIQLVIQLLIDESESTQMPVSAEMVDDVLKKAANHRNNIYFSSYYDRLSKTLPEDQCVVAKGILARIATEGQALRTAFDQPGAQSILEALEYDGYIHEYEGVFRFNSPILRMWWKKNAL